MEEQKDATKRYPEDEKKEVTAMNRMNIFWEVKKRLEKYTISQIDEAIDIVSTPYKEQMLREYMTSLARKEEIAKDVVRGTYKGKTEEDMEEFRLRVLHEVENAEDDVKALDVLMDGAKELKEHSIALNYNYRFNHYCIIEIMYEVMKKMVRAGVPFDVIRSYFPEELSKDVEETYHTAVAYVKENERKE